MRIFIAEKRINTKPLFTVFIYIILLINLLVFQSNIYGKNLDCTKFKNGTFTILNPAFKGYIIKRDGNIQIETFKNDVQTYIINWLSDCSYSLTPTEETLKKNPNFPKNGILTIKIIKVKENSYIQTTHSNFTDKIATFEMIKIQ